MIDITKYTEGSITSTLSNPTAPIILTKWLAGDFPQLVEVVARLESKMDKLDEIAEQIKKLQEAVIELKAKKIAKKAVAKNKAKN